jgi:hypothetical protein
MSIEKEYGMHIPVCDICREARLESQHDFYDAVAAKKEAGWKSKMIEGEWNDICPTCQEV